MRKRLLLIWISALLLLLGTALVACGDDDDDDDGGGGGGAAPPRRRDRHPQARHADRRRRRPVSAVGAGTPRTTRASRSSSSTRSPNELGLEREYKDTGFDTIFRDLAQDKFDLVIAGATILPEREKVVDFSDPYFLNEQSLLVKKDGDVRTIEDLAGKTVGVQKGTTGSTYAKENANAGDLRHYPEIDDAFNALVAGQVDGVIFDLIGTREAANTLEGLEVAETYGTDEVLAMAFAEDNDALREAANEIIVEMKQDGRIDELYQKWFKKDMPKELLDATNTPS